MALLDVQSLSVSFGSVIALEDVSLSLDPATITGVVGPNGAGKTTLLNGISGFVQASGSIRLAERELMTRPPDERARLGIGRTFQQPRLFKQQSVRANLRVAGDRAGGEGVSIPEAAALVGIAASLDRPADELPAHQRVRTEIARCLVAGARLLLVDEPAGGLGAGEVEALGQLLRAVTAQTGRAVLLIDHNMDLVVDTCSQIYVLDFGRLLFEGPPYEALKSTVVIDAYLGRDGY